MNKIASMNTRKDFIADQICALSANIAGIYRLTMKADSDNFRSSSVQGVINRLKHKGVKIVIYEPALLSDTFLGHDVIHDITRFKEMSDVIIASRYNNELGDVKDKVFTRDLFLRD